MYYQTSVKPMATFVKRAPKGRAGLLQRSLWRQRLSRLAAQHGAGRDGVGEALRRTCRGDASAGQCRQLHKHAPWMLDAMGAPRQIETILKPL